MQEYEWSTHQPLIRAVMEQYKPTFVLELGCGDNSTPIFLEYKTKLLSIEKNIGCFRWPSQVKQL